MKTEKKIKKEIRVINKLRPKSKDIIDSSFLLGALAALNWIQFGNISSPSEYIFKPKFKPKKGL